MPDKADNDLKLPVHPLLARLVGDQAGDSIALRGYVGPSTVGGHVTLYPRLDDLSESFEFAREDVLAFEKAPESMLPNGGTIVWVKKNAEVILHRAHSVKTEAQNPVGFRTGRLTIWRPFSPVIGDDSNCEGDVCTSKCNTCTSRCIPACSTGDRGRRRMIRFR
jgi:hypothetical protein